MAGVMALWYLAMLCAIMGTADGALRGSDKVKAWINWGGHVQAQTLDVQKAPAVQYRGVNVGGWLVVESWMYPDWWNTTGVPVWKGEWQFVETLGKEKARTLLEKHWDTWVTEEDFRTLSQWGIKHLRIPVGYWILGEPYLGDDEWYVAGGWKYLLRALTWAKKYNLQAIIDLHGAPGVQNAHDNCGFAGSNDDIKWTTPENLKRTNDVLVALAKNLTVTNQTAEYAGTVLGLCLLNEPWTTAVGGPITMQQVKDWSKSAVDAVIAAGWKGHIWYPDGFQLGWDGWKGFLQGPDYANNVIVADTHIYMMFDPALKDADAKQQAQKMCTGYYAGLLQNGDMANGVVVGEYSQDFPTYPAWPFAPGVKDDLKNLLLAQQKTFGAIGQQENTYARGAFFWSFKSLGRVNDDIKNLSNNPHSPWNYLAQISDGVASNLTTATYQC